MPVDVEIRRISMHPFANMIRHPADGENIARAVEGQCVFGVQPFAGENFPGDWFEPGVVDRREQIKEKCLGMKS